MFRNQNKYSEQQYPRVNRCLIETQPVKFWTTIKYTMNIQN